MKNLFKLSQVAPAGVPVAGRPATPAPPAPAGVNRAGINPSAANVATMSVIDLPTAFRQMNVDVIFPNLDTALRNLVVQLQQANDPRQIQVNTILGQLNGLRNSINSLRRQ